MNCFTQKDVWEFPAKTSVREGLSTTLGISVLQHGCLAGHVLKELLALLDASHKSELLPSSLPVLAALHDVGKANPYFLKKLLRYCHDEGRWKEFADDAVPDVEETPHPVVSAAVLKALGAPVYCCQVVAEHHGHSFLRAIPSGNAEYLGGDPWARFRKTLADEIVKLVGLEGFPSRLKDRNRKDVQTALWLGWVILADWIASRRDAPVPAGEEARCASELVAQAGFRSYRLKNARTFEQIFGFSPRRAQSVLMEAYAGPGVYVLEAPTGCGKTEAALGLAFRALNAGDASGIYFALPTQLTSNRAHERVQKAVAMYLGESADVRLSHSGVHLQSVQMGKEAAPGGIWYTSSRLGLLAPFGVGTVDQALLAILSTKFSEVRLAGLYGKVVILDEIHSYDAYTLELIAILVKKLEALGAVVIILSATLAHSGLKKVLGVSELTESSEVVVLTAKTAEGVFQVQDDEADAHPVAVELLDDDHAEEKAFVKAVECAKAGMQVIWIENTVKAAQRIHARCVQKGITSGLLHSRFRAADRDSNETRWTELFGKSGTAQRAVEGRILVGTQVLEQSLDLDADFMVTRMAPLDLLVQRFGRLWRHGSTVRPDGCERAEAWVLAVPEISEESPVLDAGMQQPFGITGRIYHPYILMRTLETLKARLSAGGNVLNLPKEVRNLMKSVFVDRDELTEAGQEYKQHLLAQTKMLEDSAKGRQGSTHEQPEEVATRMVDLPSWETVVLDEEDFEALSVCASPEEAAVLLENCVVKSLEMKFLTGASLMKADFNLVEDKWIKLVGRDPVSLHDFFASTEPPKLAGTPVQKLIVFRLLLAIVQVACPLEDEDDYAELTIDEMKNRVKDYLGRQKGGFYPYDPERPFLQHPDVKFNAEKMLPLASFLPGVCAGNTTLLFDTNTQPKILTDSDLIYALLSLVTFGMGGKKADKSLVFSSGFVKKSAPASPALGRGWLHCFPMSSDIYRSLKLNLVTQEMLEQDELNYLSKGVGTPPWEYMPLTEVGQDAVDYTQSLVGWLVPLSRFCRLFGENIRMTSGVSYPAISTAQCDLSVATRNVGSKNTQKISAVRASRSVAPWRQLDAVLAFIGTKQTEGCRSLKLLRVLRQDDVTSMWCVGIQVSEQSGEQYMSGSDDFVESIFRIAPGWQDAIFFKKYSDEMAWIDKVREKTYACVMGYYRELKAADLGSKFAKRAEAVFWDRCASVGVKMAEACGVSDPKAYRQSFREAAIAAYDDVCPKQNARQLIAYQKSRPIFKKQDEVK